MKRLLLLVACLGLAGCQTTRPQTVYLDRVKVVRPSIAPSVLSCRPEPAPLPPEALQRDLAPYVLDVIAAGRDCRRKLGTVRARIQGKPSS